MRSGGTPRRGISGYFGGTIPWVTIADMSASDGVVCETAERITDAGLAAIGNRIFPPGTILLAMYGSVGKLAIAGCHLATNQAILGLQPRDPNELDSRYLMNWLASIQAKLVFDARGVTQSNISKGLVKALCIPLPAVNEQRRIADILDKADAIRRKRREAIALTEELLRSTFLEMFGDPVTNPKGWPVKALGDAVDLFAGNSLPSGVPFTGQPGGYLLLKVGDMNTPGNEVDIVGAREWAASVPSASVVAPSGSVVIPKRGGAIATNKKRVLTRPAALDPNLMAIAPGPAVTLDYLRQWFEGVDLSKLSNGSTVPQLNKKDLAPLRFPLPTPQAQALFIHFRTHARAMWARAQTALADAETLFSGLVAEMLPQGNSETSTC